MKHLLSAKDLTHDEAVMVLDTAEAMAATQSQAVKKLPTLRGKTVVNLFFEDSTRTRLSFEAAAKRLSADYFRKTKTIKAYFGQTSKLLPLLMVRYLFIPPLSIESNNNSLPPSPFPK